MKKNTDKNHRKRLIAAVCAVTVLIGGSAGIYAFAANSSTKKDKSDESSEVKEEKKQADDGMISAGGTIEAAQLGDELGLKDTAAKLTVEKVLVSEGDEVKGGTRLYQLTPDSVSRAKITLQSELNSAQNSLLKQKTSYQADKTTAYALYESQLLLGENAQQEYEIGISSLDSKLKSASESYNEALSTINSTPSQISKKKSELAAKEKSAESLEEKNSSAKKQAEQSQKSYTSAAEKYNGIVEQYNSSASVVMYLGKALGKDISGIRLAQTVTVTTQGSPSGSGDRGDSPSRTEPDDKTYGKTKDQNESRLPDNSERSGQKEEQEPEENQDDNKQESTDLTALYEKAYREYTAQKKQLDQAESSLNSAKSEYKTLSDSLSKASSELNEIQSSISSLGREISDLESELSKAKSNLNKLCSEYNSLNASYETDKLELKNKLDTDTASCKNAKYNYDLTCRTLESELKKAQEAYDTAVENSSIFEETLSGGYICAKQDGTIEALNCQAGRNVNSDSPFVTYVDKSRLAVTVQLDQYDVVEINIGDTAVIYSSETGVTNGKITAISAGESKSLADVRFNVTVTADENSSLYRGQSVNVYFNFSGMNTNGLSDHSGGRKSDKDSSDTGRTRPDFS